MQRNELNFFFGTESIVLYRKRNLGKIACNFGLSLNYRMQVYVFASCWVRIKHEYCFVHRSKKKHPTHVNQADHGDPEFCNRSKRIY